MARPRRVPVQTEAKITRDAIVELQAQMQTITATLQNLNVQRNGPPPVGIPANDQANETDEEEDRDENIFADNPFAPLRNNPPLHVKESMMVFNGKHDLKQRFQNSMVIPEPKNISIGLSQLKKFLNSKEHQWNIVFLFLGCDFAIEQQHGGRN